MKIDCFITTNKKRPYFLELTVKALELSGFNAILIEKPLLERYFECERQAKTDIYLLCDDDCIPATQEALSSLVSLMVAHPELSQLGLGWRKDMDYEWNNSWRRGIISPDIWEFDHCGGIVAIRKGTIKEMGITPEFRSGYGDDRVMGEAARRLGYKVGVCTKLWFHNLGFYYPSHELN